ncbi:MAG: DUF1634 domain-containing protein [Chloroflexota bacterium]
MTDAEARLRSWISTTLTVGMLLAIVVMLVGLALALVTGRGLEAGPDWVAGLMGAEPGSIVMFGVLLLTLTPVVQLVVAALAFGRAGEHRYLVITLIVLGLLVGSVAIAIVVGNR